MHIPFSPLAIPDFQVSSIAIHNRYLKSNVLSEALICEKKFNFGFLKVAQQLLEMPYWSAKKMAQSASHGSCPGRRKTRVLSPKCCFWALVTSFMVHSWICLCTYLVYIEHIICLHYKETLISFCELMWVVEKWLLLHISRIWCHEAEIFTANDYFTNAYGLGMLCKLLINILSLLRFSFYSWSWGQQILDFHIDSQMLTLLIVNNPRNDMRMGSKIQCTFYIEITLLVVMATKYDREIG